MPKKNIRTNGRNARIYTDVAAGSSNEFVAKLPQELLAPMNEISELIYVADVETYELLFINDAGKNIFGIEEFMGHKCYKILQHLDAPCPFCTNHLLNEGENYNWEITNAVTGKHYLLRDRLISWNGSLARMEIAFDTTESENEKQKLQYRLDAERMMLECVRILYQEGDMDKTAPEVLARLGDFLCAERTYVFTIRDGLMYNDYEWCSECVEPQIKNLQGLPMSLIDNWKEAFDKQECVIVDDLETYKSTSPEAYEVLKAQDISSIVVAPLEQNGELAGYLGVDNPPLERMQNIASVLQTLCYFLMVTYNRVADEKQLSHQSYHDSLTAFFNRNRYMKDLETISPQGGPVGIVYLDVNGLKDINDLYGHAVGDNVLVECAERIRKSFSHQRFYRIGGDEFVIICTGIDQMEFELKIREMKVLFLNSNLCRVAIGCQWASDFDDINQIIANADAKMYEDKKDFYRSNQASKRYRHHSDDVLPLTNPDILRDEIAQNQFVVYLQPKLSSKDLKVVGAEALVRYRPKDGSLILPGNFLPILEEAQTISQVDFFVFEFVCSKIKLWVENGKHTFPVSVNFSRCSLALPSFVEHLTKICEKYEISPENLEIEITESVDAEGLDMKTLIDQIRSAGFVVALDDFGTEYATLSMLSMVEFDVLKLDKSMVDDIVLNYKARAIVESVVSICARLGIRVIAEGIESQEQLDVLKACGVEQAQGFLFSRPISTEEYEKKYLNI